MEDYKSFDLSVSDNQIKQIWYYGTLDEKGQEVFRLRYKLTQLTMELNNIARKKTKYLKRNNQSNRVRAWLKHKEIRIDEITKEMKTIKVKLVLLGESLENDHVKSVKPVSGLPYSSTSSGATYRQPKTKRV